MRFWLFAVAALALSSTVTCAPKAQTASDVIEALKSAEDNARTRAGLRAGQPTSVDALINKNGGSTVRSPLATAVNPIPARSLGIVIMPATPRRDVAPPPPADIHLTPPGLAATFYGDWPNTGFCVFSIAPDGKSSDDYWLHVHYPRWVVTTRYRAYQCRSDFRPGYANTTGSEVPDGAVADCPPGDQGVGADYNDVGTSFWVWDNANVPVPHHGLRGGPQGLERSSGLLRHHRRER